MPGKHIPHGRKVLAKAMLEMGAPERLVVKETGLSKGSVNLVDKDEGYSREELERLKEKLPGKLLRATDSFLDRAVEQKHKLHPYQAALCMGISHDHYLKASGQSQGDIRILINIPGMSQLPTSSGNGEGDNSRDDAK